MPSVDLTTLPGWSALPPKTYSITVVAKADGYRDSEPSAAVSVEKAASANLLTDSGGNILQDSNENNLEFKEA